MYPDGRGKYNIAIFENFVSEVDSLTGQEKRLNVFFKYMKIKDFDIQHKYTYSRIL